MGAVIVYVMVLAFIALRARIAREYEEFSVAKRMLPLALVFGGITATYVGPGFSIGFVDNGFHSGFLFSIVGLAYAIQNISVGLLIAPRLRALQGCYTLGDAIGQNPHGEQRQRADAHADDGHGGRRDALLAVHTPPQYRRRGVRHGASAGHA